MIWKWIAAGILAVFYGIYVAKMALQKRKGIRTDQMARGKERGRLFYTELLLKIASCCVIPAQAFSMLLGASLLEAPLRLAGMMLGIAGTGVFAVAVTTMRDSWRAGISQKEKTELITDGIYRISRNPAFLGFDLTYAGIVLMFFNWALVAATVFFAIMLHLQILQEERHLKQVFGAPYIDYLSRVNRYLGRRKTR